MAKQLDNLRGRYFFDLRTIRQDIVAGLVLGIESVPDGLAQGILAAVNPIYGLYGYMVGTFTGALFTSSVYMAVQATGAMSLVVASVPQVRDGEFADASLFALAILTGILMLAAGLLKLGALVRFVPNAVLVGFVNAVAILIVLGQLDDFTGYASAGANKVLKAIDLFFNLDQIHLQTLLVGITTIILILVLERTRLDALGMVVAIGAASLIVPVAGWTDVAQVRDIADIPSTLPRPVLPPLRVLFPLIVPAFSLAFVGLVQGTGVSKNYPNPDGQYPNASGDFVGQGVANIAAGFFQGMPVGGSVSATALVTNAGARSRLANIFAAVVIAVIILLFGNLVSAVALPAIAGLLIVVGVRALKPNQAVMVFKTGLVQKFVIGITFIASLVTPLQYAVLFGVALSGLLYVVQQSDQIVVKAWEWEPGDFPVEKDAPETVPSNAVTVLIPYGSVFFASAPLIEKQLPTIADDTRNAAIILLLPIEDDLGSTFLQALERYTRKLHEHNSILLLAGISNRVKAQLDQTKVSKIIGREYIFLHTEKVGEAAVQAWDAAHRWLESVSDGAVQNGTGTAGDDR